MLHNEDRERSNNRNMKFMKLLAIGIGTTQFITMTGCGRSNDVAEMQLMSATTKQQVLDYYANSLKYDAVVTRAADENKYETKYEEHSITDENTLNAVKDAYSKAERDLGNSEYPEGGAYITEDVFNYIKAYLNDMKISNGNIAENGITTALGYYFVDVEYDAAPAAYGEFNNFASLIGVRGAFVEDYLTGEINKSDGFLAAAVEAGNKYFLENKIEKHLTYDDSNLFQVLDGSPLYVDSTFSTDTNENTDEQEEGQDTGEEGTEETSGGEGTGEEDTQEDVSESETEEADSEEQEQNDVETTASEDLFSSDTDYSKNTVDSRKAKFDINYINSIVGEAADVNAMPELNNIYTIPQSDGTASGVGLYPCGIGGMKNFGYDREAASGKITLRYIFKESDDGSGSINNIIIYPKELQVEVPQFNTDSNVLIPEYLESEFEILIERADRAIVDGNITAMVSDSIFDDIGFGVLRGYYSKSTDLLRHMSVIRQVVARDIENKAYILEVETTLTEGPKSSNTQGTYRDKSYVVIQQFGDKFKITDWVRISRKTVDEPDIDSGNSTLKRMTALNLTGKISDDNKKSAIELINDLYTASTYKYLNGPYEIKNEDGTSTTYERGMYDCFNDDKNLLRTDKKEELNARLRSYLTTYGTNTKSEYIGTVDEWIGGYKNQVEFTTEEMIVYGDMQAAKYFRTYYLVSSMNDVWYIDEMKVLDTEDVDASKIESEYNRIKGSNSIDAKESISTESTVETQESDTIDTSEDSYDEDVYTEDTENDTYSEYEYTEEEEDEYTEDLVSTEQ